MGCCWLGRTTSPAQSLHSNREERQLSLTTNDAIRVFVTPFLWPVRAVKWTLHFLAENRVVVQRAPEITAVGAVVYRNHALGIAAP